MGIAHLNIDPECDRKLTVGWVDDLGNYTTIGGSVNDFVIGGAAEDLFVLGATPLAIASIILKL